MSRTTRLVIALSILLLATPVFFDSYREMVFNTVSHDDYAPYLLHIERLPEGQIPGAPYTYRYLSVLAAAPFYHLPLIRFTQAGEIPVTTLRAYEALAFTSYLAVLLTSLLLFHWFRRKGLDPAIAMVPMLGSLLLCRYLALTGVDALAVLVVAGLLYLHARGWLVAFLCVSIGTILINEKILIVMALYFIAIFLQSRKDPWYGAISLACFGGYIAVRRLVPFPGSEHQMQPGAMARSIGISVRQLFDSRGLVLNLLPVVLLILIAVLFSMSLRSRKAAFVPVFVIAGMTLVSLLSFVEYNVGRIVMYVYPVLAACYLRSLEDAELHVRGVQHV